MLPSTWQECCSLEQEGHFIQSWHERTLISYWKYFHSLNDRLNAAALITGAFVMNENNKNTLVSVSELSSIYCMNSVSKNFTF